MSFHKPHTSAADPQKIKDDPSQWSETAARKRFFEAIEL
jgi:hypothetical protein